MKSYLFILLSLLTVNCLQAQNNQTISLDKAIEMGVKNSKQLQLSRARLEEATAAVKEAEQRKLPDVTASGSYLRVANPTISLKTQTKSSGTGSDTSHTTSTPKVSQAAYGLVNVSLPLYSGLRIKYGIEASKFLEQAAQLDIDNDKEGVVLNIIDAYNNLYKAGLQIDVINSSLQQSDQRVKDFTNLEANGLLARNDLLKSQLQVSNIQLSLVDARNDLKLNTIVLDLLLGLPDSITLSLDSSSFTTPPIPGNADDYMQQALQNRKDLQAVDYRIKAQGSAVKSAQGEKYPSIALTGGYIAADVPNVFTVYNAVNVGVGVNYSLSSLWKTDAKVAQAKARERQAEANRGELSDQIQLQVGRAYLSYTSSLEKIKVYQLAIEQAEENYKITKNKFDNSLATTTDLLEAEASQLGARLNYTSAKSDAAVAYKRLQQAVGAL